MIASHFPDQTTSSTFFLRRRRLVQSLVAAGASAPLFSACSAAVEEAAPAGLGPTTSDPRVGSAEPTGRLLDSADARRILVIVDLQGGNDGLSTLVPAGSGRYHDLRPDLAVQEPLSIDDEVGLKHMALQSGLR